MDTHCDFCDAPCDPGKYGDNCDFESGGCEGSDTGVISVADSRGHRWTVVYDIQGGERSDRSPMRMFVKLSVDGHKVSRGDYGENLYVSGETLKTTTTSEFETFTGVLTGKDQWDFDMDDQAAMDCYSEDCRAFRGSIEQVEAALTAFVQNHPSELGYESLWDELVEGQRRHDEEALREEMDRMMYRIEDEMSGLDLTNQEKAAVLRRMADKLDGEA